MARCLTRPRGDASCARRNAAARLDHPFITKVYEVGQSDAAPGIPFIAMELVEGETLQ